MARWLIVSGVVLVAAGLVWPWLGRPALWRWFGRLPGDLYFQRNGFSFFFPFTTCIIVSLVLTILLWLWRR
ncbi:MAG TPA: DUF2905 domain-containing protein [Burkholderiales bacterium]|nr:DUF2905 domain-containing protein [Burkholderiales bacterium]